MKLRLNIYAICTILFCFAILCSSAKAEDWATYQHDNHRSGVTSENLNLPLNEQWRYISRHAPQQAWPDPAKQDFWHNIHGLRALVKYDQTFNVAIVGDAVYFGSSADDKVYCLDIATGEERWSFFTGGPVRFAPTIWKDRIYFGSDDGYVYCLEAKSGESVWKYRAASSDRMIPGNSRMISVWPVRSSVLIKDGVAYFCAGIFPKENVYLCALDALTGTEIWKEKSTISPQGYILASESSLYVPTGRTSPAIFNRADGKHLGTLSCSLSDGGTYALLTKDTLISGPGKALREFKAETRDQVATFAGHRMLVTDKVSYLLSEDEILAVDRDAAFTANDRRAAISEKHKKLTSELAAKRERRKELESVELEALDKKIDELVAEMSALDEQSEKLKGVENMWRRKCDRPYHSMILAGDLLFVGGDDAVVAFGASDGKRLWSNAVTGKAYGLAVANDNLIVSTDKGVIHCFGERFGITRRDVVPDKQLPDHAEDYESIANRIIEETGITQGYCLILDCGKGELAYELAKQTELSIIGIDDNEKKVLEARKYLDKAGLYGIRVAVWHHNSGKLPYTDYFANLIVSKNTVADSDEIYRVLRPYGGVAYLGYAENKPKMIQRDGLDGAGEWTHQYAEPGNSACSGDRLVKSPMQVQWFGKPGPRAMIDRHHRALGPLWKDGRLFVPAAGENEVIAVDAYNGTILWEVEVPNYRRVGANRDSGNMAVASDYLYVAKEDTCWGLNVVTGEHQLTFKVPKHAPEVRYWGYIATADKLIFGTGQKRDASHSRHHVATIGEVYYDNRPIATSDYLFCLDRHNGQEIWHYMNGPIINPAIAVGDKCIYFVESRNPAIKSAKGRITLRELLADGHGYLVALNRETGKKEWERQVNLPFEHTIHASLANDTVLILGASNESGHPRYDLWAFNANDGKVKWSNHSNQTNWPINGGHGEQDQHAVIVDDNIYMLESHSYNLQTGEQGTYVLHRGGHGCGTVSGSMSYLFARGGNPRMYKITDKEESGFALTNISRPGCWINIIPAGGLVLIPEFSSGCTCAYPIQASIALVPKRL